jgi:hypothetical protein
VSQASILVPSARNILVLRSRRHVQEKDTRGKFLHGSGCQVAEEISATRLAYRACFKVSVERNMETSLGQRCKYANELKKDTMRPLPCNFNEPREGKIGSFSTFRESEKCKRRLQ